MLVPTVLPLFCGCDPLAEGPVKKGFVKEEQEGVRGCPLQLQHCDVVGAANMQHGAGHKEGLLGPTVGPVPAQVAAIYPQLALEDGDGSELCPCPPSPLSWLCTALPCSNLGASQRCPR